MKYLTLIIFSIFFVTITTAQDTILVQKYTNATEFLNKSMPDVALSILFDLLKNDDLEENLKDKIKISIAEGYREKRDFEKGINILNNVIDCKITSYQNKIQAYNRLAALYNEFTIKNLPLLDSTIKYSQLCIELSKKHNFNKYIALSENELGYIYMRKNDYNKSIKHYKKAFSQFNLDKDFVNAANTAINICNWLIKNKKYAEAINLIDSSAQNLNEKVYRNMFMRLYLQKANIYEKNQRFDSAYKYLSLGRIAQKLFFKDRMNKQIYELAAKYELQDKTNKIKVEQAKFKNEQQSRIYLITLSIALTIVLLISIIAFYFIRKHLRQKNQLQNYENQLLNEQITFKKKEVTSAIAQSVSHNDTLKSIKHLIENKEYKDAKDIINSNINTSQSWNVFLVEFNNLYPLFFSNLCKKHTTLTNNEIKLCALLKMELKSRDIADVLNIEIVSVNKNRQRLRKKLNLPSNSSLTNYLSTV